jgi:hypothetical protein
MTTEAIYRPWVPPDRGFYVYRTWAIDGHSVYIGMVGAKGRPGILGDRLLDHEMTAEWWPEVAHIDWAEFSGTRETLDEETRQIAEHGPVHNKMRPRPRVPGATVALPSPRAVLPLPAPLMSALPTVVRPPDDKVSDADFAQWPYWVDGSRGWVRYSNDATGPPPGVRRTSYPRGSR